MISDWTRNHSKFEAMKILANAGVQATLNLTDIREDEHLTARGTASSAALRKRLRS